jgi:hypothetical protein
LLDVGLEVGSFRVLLDLVVEARKSQELRAGGRGVLELGWHVDQAVAGELHSVSDLSGRLRVLRVEVRIPVVELAVSLSDSVDDEEVISRETSLSLLVISKVKLEVKRSVHRSDHVGHVSDGGLVGGEDLNVDSSRGRVDALVKDLIGERGRSLTVEDGQENDTAISNNVVNEDFIAGDVLDFLVADSTNSAVKSSLSSGREGKNARLNGHQSKEAHASQLNDDASLFVVEQGNLASEGGPGLLSLVGRNVLDEGS